MKASNELAKEKGKRLQQAREMVRFDRKEAAKIAEVSVHTYKGWEVGKYDGLPENRAKKLLPALAAEGLQCSLEWLMHGIGDAPKKTRGYQVKEELGEYTISESAPDEKAIKDELALFCKNCTNPLYLTIDDDSMTPQFLPGDVVAGKIVPKRTYKELIGSPCIIQLKTGEILLRQLQHGTIKNHYDLVCTNQNTQQTFCLSNIEIANVAVILWHRREMKICRK
jgi:DNA-binding XRE family transcriptional regulator